MEEHCLAFPDDREVDGDHRDGAGLGDERTDCGAEHSARCSPRSIEGASTRERHGGHPFHAGADDQQGRCEGPEKRGGRRPASWAEEADGGSAVGLAQLEWVWGLMAGDVASETGHRADYFPNRQGGFAGAGERGVVRRGLRRAPRGFGQAQQGGGGKMGLGYRGAADAARCALHGGNR